MPGLIARTMTIIKAKYSKLLDKTENPNEVLDYSYEQQLQQLQNVKRGIADVATAKKRLEMQYNTMQQQADKLDGQAKAALQANREDLAREALTRKAAVQDQLQGIMESGQQLEAQQQKLVESEKTLAAKIEQFRTQKEVIKAQYSAAEAQVRIGEAATGISTEMSDVGLAVQRAKDKTESMQARADAIGELTAAGALEDLTSTQRRHRPPAQADPAERPGRRRAGEAQGRDRRTREEPTEIDARGGAAAALEPAEEPAAADARRQARAAQSRAPRRRPSDSDRRVEQRRASASDPARPEAPARASPSARARSRCRAPGRSRSARTARTCRVLKP